jgi:hypothetical protein
MTGGTRASVTRCEDLKYTYLYTPAGGLKMSSYIFCGFCVNCNGMF